MTHRRYEISIVIGPCSQDEAEAAMQVAHEAVKGLPNACPGTALNYWNDDEYEPGSLVMGVEIL